METTNATVSTGTIFACCGAADGDQEALGRLFSAYRERLKRMIELRLSRRLSGRVDDSDVLQEAYMEIARKLGEYAPIPSCRHSCGCGT